ncbi:MAG: hypothetical protein QOD30_43 [Actinomycetota bacterium]|nr:hypothetical protein [Actinomycetota bacterium]
MPTTTFVDVDVVLPDGRSVSCAELGDQAGAPVIYLHGTPSSRLDLVFKDAALRRRGLRVVSIDRPGYGRSTIAPGLTLVDCARDVGAVATVLGFDRFGVLGISGGGPYAAACAATLGDRLSGVAIVAGVTDMRSECWSLGLAGTEFDIFRQATEAATVQFVEEHYGDEDGPVRMLSEGAYAEVDLAYAASPALAAFVEHALEPFRQGLTGVAHDAFRIGQPWPFDPSTIEIPVVVSHGDFDTTLPEGHSRHTASLIPTATYERCLGHGHLTMFDEVPRLMTRIAP